MKTLKNHKKALVAGILAVTMAGCGTGALAFATGSAGTTAAASDTAATDKLALQINSASLAQSASSSVSTKDETVYIMTNADGSAKKVIVSDLLTNPQQAATLKDVSNLKDISNVGGDQTYTAGSNNTLTWDAQGQDIEYQGTSSASLPVTVSVTYKLDGKTIKPDALAGKSGHVTITYQYTNNSYELRTIAGKQEKIYVPFVLLTGMALDNSVFKNIAVSNGKLLNDGDRTYVVGFALPGMNETLGVDKSKLDIPSSVEFSADVTDFSLTTALTMATNSMFQNTDFSDITDLQDLTDSMNKLTDAMTALMDGSSELYDGLDQLLTKSQEMADGVTQLTDGAGQLYSGSSDLCNYLDQLTGGLTTLSSSSSQVNSGAAMLVDAIFQGATTQLRTQLTAAGMTQAEADQITLTRDNYTAVLAKLSSAAPTASQIAKAQSEVAANLTAAGVTDAQTQVLVESLAEDLLSSNSYKTVSDALTAAGALAKDAAVVQPVMVLAQTDPATFQKEIAQLATAAVLEQLPAGTAPTAEMVKSAQAALVQKLTAAGVTDTNQQYVILALADQLLQNKTCTNVSDAVTKSAALAGNALVVSNAKASASADKAKALATAAVTEQLASAGTQLASVKSQLDKAVYYLQQLALYTGGVDQAAVSAGQIAAGARTLSENLHTFYTQMNVLKDGTGLLIDGIQQLKTGSMELSDGLQQLNDEGIQKLADAVNGDLTTLTDRLDALRSVSGNYTSFSGAPAGVTSTVKFVFRSDSIGA